MMPADAAISTVLVLIAPIGLVYSWYFFFTRMRHEHPKRRNRISVVSLGLVSLVMLLWPVMVALMPKANWTAGVGVDHQMEWVEAWHKPIYRTLLGALALCLIGRPRLILPLVVACVGTALFWMISTAP